MGFVVLRPYGTEHILAPASGKGGARLGDFAAAWARLPVRPSARLPVSPSARPTGARLTVARLTVARLTV